jgi:replicative DNA helicase
MQQVNPSEHYVETVAHRHSLPVRDAYLLAAVVQDAEYVHLLSEQVFASQYAREFFVQYKHNGLSGIAACGGAKLYADLIVTYVPLMREIVISYALDSYANNVGNELLLDLSNRLNGGINLEELRDVLVDYMSKLSSIGNGNRAQHLQKVFQEAIEYSKRRKDVRMPYAKLSEYVDRLSNDLVIIGARTSVGKTSFALDLSRRMARDGIGVYIVTLEMDRYSIAARLVSSITKKPYREVVDSVSEYDIDRLKEFNIYIQDAAQAVSENIPIYFAEAQSLGCDVLVLDYLQLLYSRKRTERRDLEIAYTSALMRDSVKRYNISAIALAQLNRLVEARNDKKPRLSDLRDSGSIEMDADVVLLLSREEDKVNVQVAKNRNGRVGEFILYFNKDTMCFDELPEPSWTSY